MLFKIALIAILSLASCNQDDPNFATFLKFTSHHNKLYSTEREFKLRFEIFKSNLETIKSFSKPEDLSPFMDLTDDEFEAGYLSEFDIEEYDISRQSYPKFNEVGAYKGNDRINWVEKGVVSPIKNQEQCGSCWAFSAISSVESHIAIATGTLKSLSEQQLVDCDKKSKGCKGGFMDNVFKYIINNNGVETEESYPYTAKTNKKCGASQSQNAAKISSFVDVEQDEEVILEALFNKGPLSIAIHANPLKNYVAGQTVDLPHSQCNPHKLNHGVVIVGFEVFNGEKVWIIRNSWGTAWGDEGYFRLKYGSNVCGLSRSVSFPIV